MFHFLKWGENALSFHSYCQRAVTCLKGGGGGGGGGGWGFRPINLEKRISS